MPIRKAPLPIQFSGGVETRVDPKQVPTTRLLDLQNATFVRATTLAKRNGYAALGQTIDATSRTVASGVGLATRGDELIQFADDGHAYSYRADADAWNDTGGVSSVVASGAPIARTGTAQSTPDIADRLGVRVCAWEDSRGGVWCSVLDTESGRSIQSQVQLDALGQMPRCVPVGDVLHILWARPSASRIYVAIVNPALPTTTLAPAILTDDLSSSNPTYDAVSTVDAYSTERPAFIAWCSTANNGYRAGYLAPSGVLGSPVTGYPSAVSVTTSPNQLVIGAMAVAYGRIDGTATVFGGVGYTDINGTHVDLYTTALVFDSQLLVALGLLITQRMAMSFGAVRATAGGNEDVWIAVEQAGASVDTNTVVMLGMDYNGTLLATSTLHGHGLASRAWYDSGHVYALVTYPVGFYPYLAAIRVSENAGAATPVVARLSPGQATGLPSRNCVASVVPNSDGGRSYSIATTYRIQLSSANGDQFSEQGIMLFALDFDNAAAYHTAELGRGLYLAGANPGHYDGATWAEAEFHAAPDVAQGAGSFVFTQGTGGALTLVAKYGYIICYESIDANGELHQGAASSAILGVVTLTGPNNRVRVTLPMLRLTKRPRVRLGVYRTIANASAPYYRVASIDPTATGDNGYVLNDPTADAVTFADAMSDATAATMEELYTTGGILSNDPSPWAGGVIAGGKSRLFWTDPTDPNLVRYSQQLRDDTALESAAPLSLRCDPAGGRIVMIAVMDDAVIVGKETALHIFAGPGPDADGGQASQSAFTPPALLTSDVGCKSPASVCQSPIGITFQSEKGIVLLNRSRSVESIGDAVYAYNDQTVTRATLLPDRRQIVFLTDDGRTLLYDYTEQIKQWSTYTQHEGYDAVVLDGTYHYLRTDGRVFRETPGVYRDDNLHIPMRIETAWIKASGYLQGWQRILLAYFLGTYKSSHTLQIRYRLDYQDAWSIAYEANVDSNFDPSLYGAAKYGVGLYGGPGGASGSVYQRWLHFNQRCQAIQFRIEDVEATGTYGAAFELSELLLVGGVLGNAFKPGPARAGG